MNKSWESRSWGMAGEWLSYKMENGGRYFAGLPVAIAALSWCFQSMNKLVRYTMLTAKFPGTFLYHFRWQWEDNYIKIIAKKQGYTIYI